MPDRLKPHLWPLLTLLIITLAVFGQTLGHEFLSNWDDHAYVTRNGTIRGITPAHLKAAFTSLYVGNYAPVQIISYMVDHTLWGMRPLGFHATNLLLHAVNGLLFYLLAFRITGRRAWAFPATALFLLHPVQVESVAWISQRKNLLAMCFFLAAALSYVDYRQRQDGRRALPYTLALLLFVIALLAKPVAVILPLALLLYDLCCAPPVRRPGLVTDKIPFVAAAAAMAAVTFIVQSAEMGGGRAEFHGGTPLATFFTMQTVLVRYLGMLFWPANLSALYIPPIHTGIDVEVSLALLLAGGLCVAGVALFRHNRRLFFGYALFFLGLLPVSQIVPLVTLMNDRYLYFPLLGAAWLVGGLSCTIADMAASPGRTTLLAAGGAILIVLALVSFQRTAVWHDSVTLWSDVVKKTPDSREAFAALAESYVNAGRNQEALRTYDEVFAFRDDFVEPIVERKALNNAAALYMNVGRLDKARPLLQTLAEKYPDYAPGFINLGYCHFASRNLSAAEEAYRAALSLAPGNTSALLGLGNINLETGKTDAARRYYDEAFANGGNGPDLQYNLACLEAQTGHHAEALRHLAEALRLGYRNRNAIQNNPELASLRRLPSFRGLMATYFPGAATP
jgi:Flp pilus assembly protein TadD